MATKEVVRDAPSVPLAPIDESVVTPKSVRDAAARAESFYQKQPDPEPTPEEVAAAAETARAEAAKQAAENTPTPSKKASKPAPSVATEPAKTFDPVVPPDHDNVTEDQWEHRYRSMKGRYDAAIANNGIMQEQMAQLGEELMRTQRLLQGNNVPAPQPTTPLITQADEQNYGSELIDLARRVAADTVAPELNSLRQQNQTLEHRLVNASRMTLIQELDRDIPDWRTINRSPRFIQWLRLPDVYSGVIRKQTLDAAYQAASAPRVKAFFEGFIRDEAVTGNADTDPPAEQPVVPVPRIAAVPLERLAAPGRAKPASGDTPGPADKPVFTRAQISKFYNDVRRGAYTGRESEKAAQENAIFAAQNDGRVR